MRTNRMARVPIQELIIARNASRLLVLLPVGATVLLAACLVAVALQPGFRTQQEAVEHVLAQHNIRYLAVTLSHDYYRNCHPVPEFCNSYEAALQVHMPAGQVTGRVNCNEGRTGCVMFIAELEIDAAPVPDITPAHPFRLWVEEQLQRLAPLVEPLRARLVAHQR